MTRKKVTYGSSRKEFNAGTLVHLLHLRYVYLGDIGQRV